MLWCVACVAHIAHTYMQTYRSNQNVASEFSLKMCGEPLRCSSPVKPCPLAMRKGRETVGLVTADLYTVTTFYNNKHHHHHHYIVKLYISVCVALRLRSLLFPQPVYVASRYFQ